MKLVQGKDLSKTAGVSFVEKCLISDNEGLPKFGLYFRLDAASPCHFPAIATIVTEHQKNMYRGLFLN